MANRGSLTTRCLQCVTEAPCPVRPCDIARKLKVPSNSVRMVLIRLADRGEIAAHQVSPTRTEYYPPSLLGWRFLENAMRRWHR